MNIDDAYLYAIDKVMDLKNQGLDISIIHINDDGVKKKSKLPIKYWCEVEFIIKNANESDKIQKLKEHLSSKGIFFDTDFDGTQLDWSFDWSFYIGEPIEPTKENTPNLYKLFNKMNGETNRRKRK